MRSLLQALVIQFASRLLPGTTRQKLLRRLYGHEVHPTARIGLSLVAAEHLDLARDSGIGHFTVIRGLRELKLAEEAQIGNFNWIVGMPLGDGEFYKDFPDRDPSLQIDYASVILHRHVIDCTDKITIGQLGGLGGYRSTLLTHGIDIRENRQTCGPITIGERTMIASNCVLLAGTNFPSHSVLAAGSCARARNEEPGLYSGVPAKRVAELPADAKFFTRTSKMIY